MKSLPSLQLHLNEILKRQMLACTESCVRWCMVNERQNSTSNSSAIFGPSRNRRVLRQSTGPKVVVKSLNSWNTLGYMAADITSSGVMSSPCVSRSCFSKALKSIGGSEAPGRPSTRGSDFNTCSRRHLLHKCTTARLETLCNVVLSHA